MPATRSQKRRRDPGGSKKPPEPTHKIRSNIESGEAGWQVTKDDRTLNWATGVPLRRANFPRDKTGRVDAESLHIEPGDWITVQYVVKITQAGYQSLDQEFASVRAIRRCGPANKQYVMLLVSWGYPVSHGTNDQQSVFLTLRNGPTPLRLQPDDIVASDHFDIIYLENVNDVVAVENELINRHAPGRAFKHALDTRDFKVFSKPGAPDYEEKIDVRLCQSIWLRMEGLTQAQFDFSRIPIRKELDQSWGEDGFPTARPITTRNVTRANQTRRARATRSRW